jgi:hypothetical protein
MRERKRSGDVPAGGWVIFPWGALGSPLELYGTGWIARYCNPGPWVCDGAMEMDVAGRVWDGGSGSAPQEYLKWMGGRGRRQDRGFFWCTSGFGAFSFRAS